MALSFCSDYLGCIQQHNHVDQVTAFPQEHTQVAATDQLLGWHNNNLGFSDTNFINPLFEYEFDELFYSDTYTNLLPYFSSPSDDMISLFPDIFSLQEHEPYHYLKNQKLDTNASYCSSFQESEPYGGHCLKRQKIVDANYGYHSSNFAHNFFDGYISSNDLIPDQEYLPEIPSPLPKFEAPPAGFSVGSSEQSLKKQSEVSLSAQSIAARQRRRKITEKTQELAKLIPGGNKMNTAEMFQAASKYVKFLQAQLGILEFMGPIDQGRKEQCYAQDLEILLASPTIQEKLYSEEKCLVPREFVQTVANDHELQSKSSIMEEINQLLVTKYQHDQ